MKMKEALLLVLFIVPCSCASYMKKVYLDSSPESLNTNSGYNYFYMDAHFTIFDLYFYLEDVSYGLSTPIEYCVTNTYPGDSSSFSCNYYSLYSYNTKDDKKYYKIYSSSLSIYNYVVVRYTGKNPGGTLYVKSSNSDIFDIVGTALSIVAIVGIVIGSIVFLSVLITVLCCIFRRRRIYGGVGYIPPQPAVVVTTPLNPY